MTRWKWIFKTIIWSVLFGGFYWYWHKFNIFSRYQTNKFIKLTIFYDNTQHFPCVLVKNTVQEFKSHIPIANVFNLVFTKMVVANFWLMAVFFYCFRLWTTIGTNPIVSNICLYVNIFSIRIGFVHKSWSRIVSGKWSLSYHIISLAMKVLIIFKRWAVKHNTEWHSKDVNFFLLVRWDSNWLK